MVFRVVCDTRKIRQRLTGTPRSPRIHEPCAMIDILTCIGVDRRRALEKAMYMALRMVMLCIPHLVFLFVNGAHSHLALQLSSWLGVDSEEGLEVLTS